VNSCSNLIKTDGTSLKSSANSFGRGGERESEIGEEELQKGERSLPQRVLLVIYYTIVVNWELLLII